MKQRLIFPILFLLSTFIIALTAFQNPVAPVKEPTPKIQVAILLDVSGSMNGLINQAKAQLWTMVSTMSKAKCQDNVPPVFEIALYEYARTSNGEKNGYVRRINGFINDLDSLSQNLFSLTIDGSAEYCAFAINNAVDELQWDTLKESYKVIFIAGNEDFLQGPVSYTTACVNAAKHGVIINTIFCGAKQVGISEHWQLTSCGNGSFSTIDQNAKDNEVPTPYDSVLFSMNDQLNSTYISYGAVGTVKQSKQLSMDKANTTLSAKAGLERVKVKGRARAYDNAEWDLVDAKKRNQFITFQNNLTGLADSIKTMRPAQLDSFVTRKSQQRDSIQRNIAVLSVQRDNYIKTEQAKTKTGDATATLETAVESIIREQAARFNMVIE